MFHRPDKFLAWLLAAAALYAGGAAHAAATDTPLTRSIQTLGELNGRALACKHMALAARLREIIIDHAPKERSVGELYEQATSQSYLQQGQSASSCPDGKQLAADISQAETRLKAAQGASQ